MQECGRDESFYFIFEIWRDRETERESERKRGREREGERERERERGREREREEVCVAWRLFFPPPPHPRAKCGYLIAVIICIFFGTAPSVSPYTLHHDYIPAFMIALKVNLLVKKYPDMNPHKICPC